MPPRSPWLACCACVLALAAPAAAAGPPPWSLASLPGGRAGLLPGLGLSSDLPVALTTGEVIRVAHASRDLPNRHVDFIRAYLAAPPAGPAERIPLPLPVAAWRDLLGGGLDESTLLGAVWQDRRASLLCYGLLQLDAETLAFVAGDPGLQRRLYERHSGVLAAFAQVLHVRDGQLQLPGGSAAAAAWSDFLGVPLSAPSRAIDALLGRDDGRLAYFADAVSALDQRRLPLVFHPGPRDSVAEKRRKNAERRRVKEPQQGTVEAEEDDDERFDRVRSVYDAFTGVESGWKLGEFPFVRLGADPALLLTSLRTDDGVRLRHTEEFWKVVLGDEALPRQPEKEWEDLDEGDRAEPGWLLAHVTDAALPDRVDRLYTYEVVERLTDRFPASPAYELAWLARAYRRYPSLVLGLERLDVVDSGVYRQLVGHAARLGAAASDDASRENAFALYQAPLMLLTRARQARAIDADTVRTLTAAFASLDPSKAGYGRAVAAWIGGAFLPALGHDGKAEGASAEVSLLEALAGLRAPRGQTAARALVWESHTYRVDAAAPELARLIEVRGLQGGNTLDAVLELCRVGAALARETSLPGIAAAASALAGLQDRLDAIETSERTSAPAPPDVPGILEQAVRDLARVRSNADVKRASAIAARLTRAEDAALADVLMSLAYALWLGDPQGQPFLAGNVARRHDFGVRFVSGADRESTPWLVPSETSGDGEPWHLRGSVLGLDIGLGRLALRRTRIDLPEDQPTLNESDRRTLIVSLVLTGVADLDQAGADRMAGWLARGRERAGRPAEIAGAVEALDLDGRRRQAVLWAAEHTPDALPSLFMTTELVLLGREPDAPIPPVWGMAQTPRTGCLCLDFADPPAVHRVAGRAGAGLLASRMADLKLRVLELLHSAGLPAVLVRGVLAAALQDYLDDVRPAHGDDWWALAHQATLVARDRFDDYVAALTAGGPLVPLDPAAPLANGHE